MNDELHPTAANAAQAAFCLGATGRFQVWSKAGWVDVAARGVAPVAGREYEVKFVFDYAEKVYSVAIDGKTRFRSLKGSQTAAVFF